MFTEADLLDAIERHLTKTGETATAFGKRVANDPSLVNDLRVGRSPRMRLAAQIMTVIEADQLTTNGG